MAWETEASVEPTSQSSETEFIDAGPMSRLDSYQLTVDTIHSPVLPFSPLPDFLSSLLHFQ